MSQLMKIFLLSIRVMHEITCLFWSIGSNFEKWTHHIFALRYRYNVYSFEIICESWERSSYSALKTKHTLRAKPKNWCKTFILIWHFQHSEKYLPTFAMSILLLCTFRSKYRCYLKKATLKCALQKLLLTEYQKQ